MDFQGQGKASSGETEVCAIMDTFTKTIFILPLQDRHAETLLPSLLGRIIFTRGRADTFHLDAAKEFCRACSQQ